MYIPYSGKFLRFRLADQPHKYIRLHTAPILQDVYSPEDAVSVIPLSPERNLVSLARHAFGEEDCGQ